MEGSKSKSPELSQLMGAQGEHNGENNGNDNQMYVDKLTIKHGATGATDHKKPSHG